MFYRALCAKKCFGRCSACLGFWFEQFRKVGEGRKGGWSIRLMARRRLTGRVSYLVPLVLIVVAVEAEQLPVAPVWRIVVVVVVFVMDRELVQFLTVEFPPAMGAKPRKEFERMFSMGQVTLRVIASCHASLVWMGTRCRAILYKCSIKPITRREGADPVSGPLLTSQLQFA